MCLEAANLCGPAVGIDTDTALTAEIACCLAGRTPYRFVGRYISNGLREPPEDLSRRELHDIAAAGVGVVVIQHALAPGSLLTRELGKRLGRRAARHARSVGVPACAFIWLDLQDYGPGSDAVGFARSWARALRRRERYVPALYYGAPGLAPDQVEALLGCGLFASAWAGCGQARGTGEDLDQGPCDRLLELDCGDTPVSLAVDEDVVWLGHRLGGAVVAGR